MVLSCTWVDKINLDYIACSNTERNISELVKVLKLWQDQHSVKFSYTNNQIELDEEWFQWLWCNFTQGLTKTHLDWYWQLVQIQRETYRNWLKFLDYGKISTRSSFLIRIMELIWMKKDFNDYGFVSHEGWQNSSKLYCSFKYREKLIGIGIWGNLYMPEKWLKFVNYIKFRL